MMNQQIIKNLIPNLMRGLLKRLKLTVFKKFIRVAAPMLTLGILYVLIKRR
jgi:hypothetical protein